MQGVFSLCLPLSKTRKNQSLPSVFTISLYYTLTISSALLSVIYVLNLWRILLEKITLAMNPVNFFPLQKIFEKQVFFGQNAIPSIL